LDLSIDINKDKWKKRILEIIADSPHPAGSWHIVSILHSQGIEVSSATVGRELSQLETLGFLEKQNHKGRTITALGRAVIDKANSRKELDDFKSSLEEVISSDVLENYLMVLEAREAIERETARLAARRITDKELAALEALLSNQEEQVKNHRSIALLDIAFHSGIARASKNDVLFSLYRIISTMGQQSPLFEKLRMRVGDSYSNFHEKIFKALKERDSARAEEYMMLHISRLKDDVNRYWHEFNPSLPGQG
jgi:DNA-binding FadR family transcriptional regulator